MRELDVLLQRYLERRYASASQQEQQAFEALLTLPDPQLFAYVVNREQPTDPHPLMSSPGLPTLTIDIAARRGERRIAVATLFIVPCAVAQWGLSSAALAGVGALVVVALAYGFIALGWVGGGSRLTRIVCRSDGTWSLCEASGQRVETDLTTASRISPQALWLRWDARRPPLLLLRGDIPDNEFRQLLVRLRVAPWRTKDEHEIAV
jgi:hypothetical protein